MAREPDPDELIDRWTLVGDEPELVAGKRGATRLGFALLLRFYTERGRFPRSRSEFPDAVVDYVARQVGVAAAELAFYEWSGRTIEFHPRQIRSALGFRECGVADADKLTEWLVSNVTQVERGRDPVRDELLARCRAERIEPPAAGRAFTEIVCGTLIRNTPARWVAAAARCSGGGLAFGTPRAWFRQRLSGLVVAV